MALTARTDAQAVLVLDDATGAAVDFDLRGGPQAVAARYAAPSPSPARGRPRLGVTPREVTLLPSQWEWLARQPGGASAALRRLVDQARRSDAERLRQVREALHRILTALAGDRPGYEEALRALHAGDAAGFARRVGSWPADIAAYVTARAAEAFPPPAAAPADSAATMARDIQKLKKKSTARVPTRTRAAIIPPSTPRLIHILVIDRSPRKRRSRPPRALPWNCRGVIPCRCLYINIRKSRTTL